MQHRGLLRAGPAAPRRHPETRARPAVAVGSKTFGYLWEPTRTVGLKQTIAEQLALVAERPEVFEVQFTAYGFGWVVVHLEGVERDELAELIFEAWRLTRPRRWSSRGDRLPR